MHVMPASLYTGYINFPLSSLSPLPLSSFSPLSSLFVSLHAMLPAGTVGPLLHNSTLCLPLGLCALTHGHALLHHFPNSPLGTLLYACHLPFHHLPLPSSRLRVNKTNTRSFAWALYVGHCDTVRDCRGRHGLSLCVVLMAHGAEVPAGSELFSMCWDFYPPSFFPNFYSTYHRLPPSTLPLPFPLPH